MGEEYYNKDLQEWLACGNASLHDLNRKGYTAYEEERAASGKQQKVRFKYTGPQALHVGVVNQFSLHGVLLRPDSVLISLEDGKSQGVVRPDLLKQPRVIIDHYAALDFQVGIVITGSLGPKSRSEKRHKGAAYTCLIRIMPYGGSVVPGPLSARPPIKLHPIAPERPRGLEYAFKQWQANVSTTSITFISLPALVQSMERYGIKL